MLFSTVLEALDFFSIFMFLVGVPKKKNLSSPHRCYVWNKGRGGFLFWLDLFRGFRLGVAIRGWRGGGPFYLDRGPSR